MIVQFELELTDEEKIAFASLCAEAGKTESDAAREIIIDAIGGEKIRQRAS